MSEAAEALLAELLKRQKELIENETTEPPKKKQTPPTHRYTRIPPGTGHPPAQKYLDIKHPCTHTIYTLLLNHKGATLQIKGQKYWNTTLGQSLNWTKIWTRTFQSLQRTYHLDTL